MSTYAFSGGVAAVKGAGQKDKIRFGGTWAAGDTWSAQVTSQISGDFTLGQGNIAGKVFTSVLTFKERVMLGFQEGFAISAVDDPTGWEEQNVGTAVFVFSTQYGATDTVRAMGVTDGMFYAFGENTVQAWQTDADPSKWVLSQVLDNTGCAFTRGVQSIGELDLLYVDKSGIRSIRTKELTGSAFISDVGTPIDSLVLSALSTATNVATGINPSNKNFIASFDSTGYCLSQYPVSKITAWTSFDFTRTEVTEEVIAWIEFVDQFSVGGVASGSAGLHPLTVGVTYHWVPGATTTSLVHNGVSVPPNTAFTAVSDSYTLNGTPSAWVTDILYGILPTFTPVVMDITTDILHIFGSDKTLYAMDGSFADYAIATVETPYLAVNGGKMVQLEAVEVTCSGAWKVYYATNPKTNNYTLALITTSVGSVLGDSTYDLRRYAISGNCSHVRLKFVSSDNANDTKLCSAAIVFKPSNEK